jgi:leucyl-tRNA synthetase
MEDQSKESIVVETTKRKLGRLIDIQESVKERVIGKISNANPGKPKKFVTFPYPYMNGRLHAGHAYTLSKVDFLARYYAEKGYNVLFPFGFHGTGMPIFASACKLNDELSIYSPSDYESLPTESQMKILLDMDVDPAEIPLFKDPKYWVTYFSQKGKEDIELLGIAYDPRRSFYTTDMNPYYDSFVRWQFNTLIRDNYIKKGKRYVIYSKKDNQPCADHDRSKGEGIEPVQLRLSQLKYDKYTYLITGNPPDSNFVYIDDTSKFVEFEYKGEIYVCGTRAFNNISSQLDDVSCRIHNTDLMVSAMVCNGLRIENEKLAFGTGISTSMTKNIIEEDPIDQPFLYYEPNGVVTSRSGDVCIVALTDQWFINYNDPIIKDKLRTYIETEFECYDEGVKKQFMSSVDWLSEWPCSRNFGLGTKLPYTDQIIDSLSDSTIYMAYYTVAHLLHKIPHSELNDSFWNSVFLDHPIELTSYSDVIAEMKTEFNYWYPLDLRISGKDLVQNHLTMCLFNHMMIWKKESFLPRGIMVGGYLMLEGKKMSKHTGNFLTLSDGVKKYGADAYRFALANNDGIDDGNFEDRQADVAIIKLNSELEWIENFIASLIPDHVDPIDKDIFDRVFEDDMSVIISTIDSAYENGLFRTVIQEIFKLIASRSSYINFKNHYKSPHRKDLFKLYINNFIKSLSPICPFLGEHLKTISSEFLDSGVWTTNVCTPSNYNYLKDVVVSVINEINSIITKFGKKKIMYTNITVTIVTSYSPIERQIVDYVSTYDGVSNWSEFINGIKIIDESDSIPIGSIKRFASFIKTKIAQYGKQYIEWATSGNEVDIINTSLKKIFNNDKIVCVQRDPDSTTEFNIFPGFPNVKPLI